MKTRSKNFVYVAKKASPWTWCANNVNMQKSENSKEWSETIVYSVLHNILETFGDGGIRRGGHVMRIFISSKRHHVEKYILLTWIMSCGNQKLQIGPRKGASDRLSSSWRQRAMLGCWRIRIRRRHIEHRHKRWCGACVVCIAVRDDRARALKSLVSLVKSSLRLRSLTALKFFDETHFVRRIYLMIATE